MKKFRIKVDLSTFFDDERKLVCILIDPNWENVQCLQQRVEKIFDVENLRFITDEGCFIPPQESIEVIQSSDVLKAFIPSTSKVKKKKKNEKHKETDYAEDSLELSKQIDKSCSKLGVENRTQMKKRKFKSLGLACASSTPNQAKRSKHNVAVSLQMSSTVVPNKAAYEPPTSTNEHLGILDKQKQISIVESRAEPQEKSLNNSCNVVPEKLTNISPSPVLRKRKRKNKTAKVLDSFSSYPSSTILNEIESYKNNESPMCSTNSAKGHLHFNDTGEAVTTTTLTQNNASALEKSSNKSIPKLFFRCQVAEIPLDTPRKFILKKTEDTKSPDIGIENKSTDVMNEASSTKATDITNAVNSTASITKPIIEIKEHIVIPPVNCTIVQNEKCDEADMTVDKEPTTDKTVPIADNSITDDDKHDGETMDASNIADDSSVIALDSEEENGDETDENDSDEEYKGDNNTTNRTKQKQNSPDVSEVIDLNATDEESDSIFGERKGKEIQQYREFIKGNKSIKDILPFTTMLEDLPSVGDVIVFKVKRLDNKISDYIAGKCVYANKRVKTIKLDIIGKLKDIDYMPDRYKIFLDSSMGANNESLNIKLVDMIETRIFQV